MKKLSFASLLGCLIITLCSCKVNWFTTTVDVPWYFVAIPVLLILALGYWIIFSRSYVCPSCSTVFSPKWYQLSFLIHFMGKRLGKCPHCGRKGYFERK